MYIQIERLISEIESRMYDYTEKADVVAYQRNWAYNDILEILHSHQKEPVSDDLKQAAVDAFKKVVNNDENSYFNIFKAGADWKEQKLMQDAIDGVVYNNPTWPGNVVGNLPFYSQFKQHEHVKLIVIRSNEQ